MSESNVTLKETHAGQVVELQLGPPPGNIVTMALVAELSAHLTRLESDAGRKLIVISGAGKQFSYGASVDEHKPEIVGDMLPRFHALIGQMVNMRTPTLAAVSGMCLGGGFEIALACAMIFATEKARFGVPEIQLGVFPPAASVLLPCKLGEGIVNELVLSGGTYGAGDLLRLGLVNRVVEEGVLGDAVSEFAEKFMVSRSASSLRIACHAARRRTARYFEDNIDAVEKLYLETLMSTSDAVEGINAFLEKRPPQWSDK